MVSKYRTAVGIGITILQLVLNSCGVTPESNVDLKQPKPVITQVAPTLYPEKTPIPTLYSTQTATPTPYSTQTATPTPYSTQTATPTPSLEDIIGNSGLSQFDPSKVNVTDYNKLLDFFPKDYRIIVHVYKGYETNMPVATLLYDSNNGYFKDQNGNKFKKLGQLGGITPAMSIIIKIQDNEDNEERTYKFYDPSLAAKPTKQPTPQPPDSGSGSSESNPEPTKTEDNCFLKGTKILLAGNKVKNIEKIKVGEEVVSYDIKNKKKVVKKVLELEHHNDTDHYYIVVMSNGVKLKVTGEHPIFTDKGWASIENDLTYKYQKLIAKKLIIGSKVLTKQNKWLKVKSIKKINRKVNTYNLKQIEETHTFYANDILVHNKGGEDDDIGPGLG